LDTKELLKMEAAVKDARQKVKDELFAKVQVMLEELRLVGFDYDLITHRETPKIGRPRKEGNAKAQVGQ